MLERKQFVFLDVTSPNLKDAQLHAWIHLLSPGLPQFLMLPAHGKPGIFGKEEILCINYMHVEKKG